MKTFITRIRRKMNLNNVITLCFTIPAMVLRALDYRIIPVNYGQIGHLICDPMTQELEDFSDKLNSTKYLIFVNIDEVANKYVLEKLRLKYTVVSNRHLTRILKPLKNHPFVSTNSNIFKLSIVTPDRLFKRIDLRESGYRFFPVLDKEYAERNNLLNSLGIPSDSWYVCLHVRDSEYVPMGVDEQKWTSINSCRDSTLSNTFEAVEYIRQLGGNVIRIGSSVNSPIPEYMNVIDYSLSDLQNDKNDYLLLTGAKFVLGSSSGIMAIAGCQAIPILACNTVPLGGSRLWGIRDMSLPKLYFSDSMGRFLHFKEVFGGDIANFNRCNFFSDRGVRLIENSSDEILQAVIEFTSNLNGNYFKQEPYLSYKFNSFFSNKNYSFFSTSKISSYWLNKYADLIL